MWKKELLKNKLYSVALISVGALSIPIEYDATAFIFTLMMGLPLFFAKENWTTIEVREIDEELSTTSITTETTNRVV